MREFQVSWVRLATIEALYQGRYKAISVKQILIFWQRRGQPICHFNLEFEAIVTHQLPELTAASNNSNAQVPLKPAVLSSQLPQAGNLRRDRVQLPKRPKLTNLEIETLANTGIQPTATRSQVKAEGEEKQTRQESEERFSENSGHPESDRPLLPSSANASQQPIDKFTPNFQDSQFYKKLKAVADSKTNTVE